MLSRMDKVSATISGACIAIYQGKPRKTSGINIMSRIKLVTIQIQTRLRF